MAKRLTYQSRTGSVPVKSLQKIILVAVLLIGIFISAATFKPISKISDKPQSKLEPQIPTVTLNSIFKKQNDLSLFDQGKLVTLTATGDVIPARGANWPAVTGGNFNYNWKKTGEFLREGDVALINLEAPLMAGCPLKTEGMVFCGDARHIKGLVFAGIDVVSLANNHIDNYGLEGRTETINLLEKNKVGWSGFGNLFIKETKGIKFGFLAYNDVEASFDTVAMAGEIKKADQKVDVLVVSIHWGAEYVLVPQSAANVAPNEPKALSHLIIDSGGDLVIGNHPHTVQGVELYKGKFITYAHGNFIFDQTWSQETQEGVVGKYTFYEGKLVNVEFYPILVNVSYQPKFLSKKEGRHILDRMKKSSQIIVSNNP